MSTFHRKLLIDNEAERLKIMIDIEDLERNYNQKQSSHSKEHARLILERRKIDLQIKELHIKQLKDEPTENIYQDNK